MKNEPSRRRNEICTCIHLFYIDYKLQPYNKTIISTLDSFSAKAFVERKRNIQSLHSFV